MNGPAIKMRGDMSCGLDRIMRRIRNSLGGLFELSRGGVAANLKPMEGLRGFAVFLVFMVHFVSMTSSRIAKDTLLAALAGSMHAIGAAGVDLFFVLSGYLIYGSLMSRSQSFASFMSRRVERIYPAFLVVFIVYLTLSFLFPRESKIPGEPVAALGYLVANLLLLPGIFPVNPMITVAWSLSYEMFFYLAIPAIIAVFGLRRRDVVRRVFLLLAVMVAIICVGLLAQSDHVRLIMFIAGMLLWDAMRHSSRSAPGGLFALIVAVLGMLGALLPGDGAAMATLKAMALFVGFFVLCLAVLRSPGAWLGRWFSWTPLRWLGNMSYSYYLIHGLSLKFAFMLFYRLFPDVKYDPLSFFVMLIPMFVWTLIPSSVLYILVERPCSLLPANTNRHK